MTEENVNWKEWINKYVPQNVSDQTVLALYALLSKVGMPEETNAYNQGNGEPIVVIGIR